MKHQEDLFRYIFSLLPHEEDARDVLQETSVSLYRKFADYDPEKPFLAWAYGFAYLEVLKQRERNERGTPAHARGAGRGPRPASGRSKRPSCTPPASPGKLPRATAADGPRADPPALPFAAAPSMTSCEQLGTSRRTFFRNLDRVRRMLMECITRRMHASAR